jgi:hypothetical protein
MIVNNKGITLTEDDVYHRCVECNRVFDLFHEIDLEEYSYGHDCEPSYTFNHWLEEAN